jgi:hydroxyethylthiazole kinase
MDFMANCLLSLGAAPIMTQDKNELEELIKISSGININIGTLDNEFCDRIKLAVELAHRLKKPIVLDPVGSGATNIRTSTARDIINSAAIVRGNASEVISLLANENKTLGVESTHQVSDAKDIAIKLAKLHKCTVVVSGARDFISDGVREDNLAFGSELMPLVTGMGCALTAVIAAFMSVTKDAFEASVLGTAYFSLAGSVAGSRSTSPGSFRTNFIDELYKADFKAMNRVLAKLAHGSEMQGAHGAQNRSVFNIREDSSTGATQQIAPGVEFCKNSNAIIEKQVKHAE